MKAILALIGLGFASVASAAPSAVADAAERRDWQTVRTLAVSHADVNAPQADGTTALQWAAHWNDLDAVKALLSLGGNPRLANRYGVTPLSEAAAAGNAAMIGALLDSGADARSLTTPDGETV